MNANNMAIRRYILTQYFVCNNIACKYSKCLVFFAQEKPDDHIDCKYCGEDREKLASDPDPLY